MSRTPRYNDDLAKRNRATIERGQREKGDIEKVSIYPAGRGKKLIIKTIQSRPRKRAANPRRLCLVSLPSNPQPITIVSLKKTDRFFTLWFYPEGRRLSREELTNTIGALLAYRKYTRETQGKMLGKRHLSLKSISITDRDLIAAVNRQLKRLSRRYGKFEGEYCGQEDRDEL